jgi:hypothetical protein
MSSLDGPQFLGAIQQARRLLHDIGKLLQEADGLMGEAEWKPRTGVGSTALAEWSASVHNPRQWVPYCAFRFYEHTSMPRFIPCISVILDSDSPKVRRISEPLINGILYEYEPGEPLPTSSSLYSSASWHLDLPNRADDGTVCSIEPRRVWAKWSWITAKRMQSFALPLVSIKDGQTLSSTIVEPLIRLIVASVEEG